MPQQPLPANGQPEENNDYSRSWLDSHDMMKRFNISRSTLKKWRLQGKLPFSKVGRKIFYNEADVQQLLLSLRQTVNLIMGWGMGIAYL